MRRTLLIVIIVFTVCPLVACSGFVQHTVDFNSSFPAWQGGRVLFVNESPYNVTMTLKGPHLGRGITTKIASKVGQSINLHQGTYSIELGADGTGIHRLWETTIPATGRESYDGYIYLKVVKIQL